MMDSLQKLAVNEIDFFKFIPEVWYWEENSYHIDVIDADYRAFAFAPVCYEDDVSGSYLYQKVHFAFDEKHDVNFMDDCVHAAYRDMGYISGVPKHFTIGGKLLNMYIYGLEEGKDVKQMLKSLRYIIVVQRSMDAFYKEDGEERVIIVISGDFHKLFHRLYGPMERDFSVDA